MAKTAAPDDEPSSDIERRHSRRGIAAILSMFCCSRSNVSRSVHFHANRVEDSLHVMIKHDIDAAKKKGKTGVGYAPRAPLLDRLTVAMQEANTIKATEDTDDSHTDKEILAALREQ